MSEREEPDQQDQHQKPYAQLLFDDMFLLLLLGLIVPFIIYTVWGLMDIGAIPTLPPTEFEAVATAPGPNSTPQIDGQSLAQLNGCLGCHSIDGAQSVGPGWLGVYNSSRPLTDGATVLADDGYLKNSIIDPNAQVVQGYSQGMMPAYDSFSDTELDALIEYIKSLR